METFDVVIVGGGPAGLFAARVLSKLVPSARLCLVEKGRPAQERFCSRESERGDICDACDILHGVGGVGLHVDGKLCLDVRSGMRWGAVTEDVGDYLYSDIEDLCKRHAIGSTLVIPDPPSALLHTMDQVGLNLATYPVRILGTDQVQFLALALHEELRECNITFFLEHEASDIEVSNDAFVVKCVPKSSDSIMMKTPYLLLAPGRSGALWMSSMASKLGITTYADPVDIGVRIETESKILDPLGSLAAHPRIKMEWNNTFLKTHCYCQNGFVISYELQSPDTSVRVVDGHTYRQIPSKNSNINLLMRLTQETIGDPVQYGFDLARLSNLVGRGRPILQRLGDFKAERPTMQDALQRNSVEPTLKNTTCADIGTVFPKFIVQGIVEFIDRLSCICPNMGEEDALLYATALEWCVRRIQVTDELQTQWPGLFVAGDGSGLTTGVIAAAITGIRAAKAIAQRL